MEHIPPTNDLAFRKVLASEENKDILQGFIQDFFDVEVKDVVLENPYSITDYKEVLENGCEQYSKPGVMEENKQGRPLRYSSLRAIYALNVLGHAHYDDEDALRIFELYDVKRKKRYGKDLVRLGFFELTKTKVETVNQGHWRNYFINGSAGPDAPAYIKKAERVIAYINLAEDERKVVDVLEKAEQTLLAEKYWAFKEGVQNGIQKGMQKGMQQGMQKGMQQGMQQGVLEAAQKMLNAGMDADMLMQTLGLSRLEIDSIRAAK